MSRFETLDIWTGVQCSLSYNFQRKVDVPKKRNIQQMHVETSSRARLILSCKEWASKKSFLSFFHFYVVTHVKASKRIRGRIKCAASSSKRPYVNFKTLWQFKMDSTFMGPMIHPMQTFFDDPRKYVPYGKFTNSNCRHRDWAFLANWLESYSQVHIYVTLPPYWYFRFQPYDITQPFQ